MIKNNIMGVVFVLSIAITSTVAFANEGCEDKNLTSVEASKATEVAFSGVKTAEPCESKSSDPAEPKPPTSEPGKNIVYFGGGVSRKDHDLDAIGDSNKAAFTFGYLRGSNKSRLLGGADISYEGTYLDGTYGSFSTAGAVSFNGIIGVNVARTNSIRFDVAGLVGARQETVDCPPSYLGFACYADEPPSRSYTVNYGGIVSFSYKKLVLGARVSGVSTQGLIGIRF
jgi:hypothetical protein